MANLTVSEFKRKTSAKRAAQLGVAAALLLSSSSIALHAETSNTELAKEIAELKAQIRELRGSVVGTRREVQKVKSQRAPVYAAAPPPVYAAIPEGATPVFVTSDKKMQYGALTITPGGFIAMESATRNRTEGVGISSAYNAIPTNNSNLAHTIENRFEARQSRPALLIEAPISSQMLVSGYAELDFLGAGTTSNYNQTDSYVPRIRHLYATLDNTDYGIHVLAGQEWSLVTLNSKGITPRNEVTPPQIDPSYIPGFEYARVPQIRLTKDFAKKLWLSVDLEQSAAANINGQGNCQQAVNNTGAAIAASGGILANGASFVGGGTCLIAATAGNLGQTGLGEGLSLNKIPDVLAKAAYEARFADRDFHFEVTGIYRDLYNVTNYGTAVASTSANPGGFPSSSTQDTTGYGIGAGLIFPVIPKTLDFQAQGLLGRGLGRYASTNSVPDATILANGRLSAVGAASALVGLTYHVTPSIDLYGFSGFEQFNRDYSTVGGTEVGYGTTTGTTTGAAGNNYGCNVQGGTCSGATHRVFQITGGMWDKLYKGSFGEVRVGVQYSYTQRQLFGETSNANGIGSAANPLVSAKADEQTVLTSFRYYPFQ